jgi:MoxR-like ATPase
MSDHEESAPRARSRGDAEHTTGATLVVRHFEALEEAIARVVIGQREAIRLVCITLLTRGHALIEGVPGVAKTLLVHSLASAYGLRFGRVQFTPDLMPSDIIGTPILDPGTGEVRFREGPIFTDLLLADEINRASAKTQAALLQAMQEGFVTVDGTAHELGPYFTVLATQNPVEHEGTYPLPEAEMDRFLFKIVVGYPDATQERELIALHHSGEHESGAVPRFIDGEGLTRLRQVVRDVTVAPEVIDYAASLVRATRDGPGFVLGASPRASVWLVRAAKASATLAGRDYVLPEDVQGVFVPCLRHRVQLDPSAEIEGLTPDEALERCQRGVAVPR